MTRLEKLTHTMLILLSIVSLAVVVRNSWSSFLQPHQGFKAVNIGDALDLPSVKWSLHRTNVVMAIRSDCRFCRASLQFYGQLSEIARQHPSDVAMVAVSPETRSKTETFLQNGGVHIGDVVQVSLESIGVAGTPTVFVVNSKGIITNRFFGELEHPKQLELISLITPVQILQVHEDRHD